MSEMTYVETLYIIIIIMMMIVVVIVVMVIVIIIIIDIHVLLCYFCVSFGHQDGIISIDCLSQERPITAGVDKTLRVWKIIEESHLVYHGHK